MTPANDVPERVAAIVPLFPRLPGMRQTLDSLKAQSRPPDLVVFLDDGTNPDTESLRGEMAGIETDVVEADPREPLAAALNRAVEYLENSRYVTFLGPGDFYEPARIEKCLAATRAEEGARPPALAVTAIAPSDNRGNPLADDDPRAKFLERLWSPGKEGGTLAEWLGAGNFIASTSNLFARRDYLAANPFPENAVAFAYHAATLAGLQGLLAVVWEPLLRHCPSLPEREPSAKAVADMLQSQLGILFRLKEKISSSPETRRALTAFHRAAWNNLAGLREDLFQQSLLRLASEHSIEDAQAALDETLRSRDAGRSAAHWADLLEGGAALDLAGYAAALRKAREELATARDEVQRFKAVADAAQASGWVRLGAWLGDRSARRIMEVQEENLGTTKPKPAKEPPEVAGENSTQASG